MNTIPFKHLKPGDPLYYLDPIDLTIKTLIIKKVHMDSARKGWGTVEFHLPFKKEITQGSIQTAEEVLGTVTTGKILVNIELPNMIAGSTTSTPTLYATSANQIEKWKKG